MVAGMMLYQSRKSSKFKGLITNVVPRILILFCHHITIYDIASP
jgi:hypothetical protein